MRLLIARGGSLMSPVSGAVNRRIALGIWITFGLFACQGPDEYFRNDGSSSGAAGIGPGSGGATGVAGTLGSGGTGGSVSGLGGQSGSPGSGGSVGPGAAGNGNPGT